MSDIKRAVLMSIIGVVIALLAIHYDDIFGYKPRRVNREIDKTERTNSKTNDTPHYSSWSDCVSIQIVPRAAYGIGQDVTVTNICSHTISKVVVTVTADGRSKDTYYFDIAPGESDMSAITVAADAFLYVSDVQVYF